MTLQRSLLLGLTVLCVGSQSTKALGGPHDSVQLQMSGPHHDTLSTRHIQSLVGNVRPSPELGMPDYKQSMTVGYGYNVMADELTLDTPFLNVKFLPSPIGYRIPNFVNCKIFPRHRVKTFRSYSQNTSEYFTERLKRLHFTTNEDIDVSKFSGKIKSGYNIKPKEELEIATLTVVFEVRTLECVLAEKEGELNNEFVETVRSLEPVNIYDRDSVRDWNNLFGKYGTHIVVQGYGGGSLVGSIVGTSVKKVFESNNQSVIDDALHSILTFSTFSRFSVPGLEKPSYQLFGGEMLEGSNQISQPYDLTDDQPYMLLGKWEESLNSNFDMLKHEFTLDRISTIVKEKIGESTGEMVDNAINLALKGELKHQRRRGSPSASNNIGGIRIHPLLAPFILCTSMSAIPKYNVYF